MEFAPIPDLDRFSSCCENISSTIFSNNGYLPIEKTSSSEPFI